MSDGLGYSVSEIPPYSIEPDGTVVADWESSERIYAVKKVWLDEQGRRCTTFLGEAASREEADKAVAELIDNRPENP